MKFNRSVVAAIAAVLIGGSTVAACGGPKNATNAEATIEQQQLAQYNQSQPIPFFKWSLERQILIDAETASANGDQSTSFFFNYGVQDPIFSCTSLGMAVPDTAQLSNPEQVVPVTGRWGGGHDVLPQADPFGIHTPPNSDGTYVICLIGGKPVLQRAEESVHTVMAPAQWDYKNHRIQIVGNPTTDVKTHQ